VLCNKSEKLHLVIIFSTTLKDKNKTDSFSVISKHTRKLFLLFVWGDWYAYVRW